MYQQDSKLRVMMLVPTLRAGGAERVISILLQQLRRERFELHLVAVYDAEFAYTVPDDVVYTCLAAEPDAPEIELGLALPAELAERFSEHFLWLEAVVRRFSAVAGRWRPNLIVASPVWAAMLGAMARKALPESTALVARVGEPPSVALAGLDGEELFVYLTASCFNDNERVIAVSDAIRRDLVEGFGVRPDLVEVLPNPVDISRIRSLAEEPIDVDPFGVTSTVVFVGRLERVKGLEHLLRAMAIVNQRMDAELVLVGNGSQRTYLEALARHLGLSDKVHFAGRQPNPFQYMKRATLFVLPSLSEGMPNVLLEAMASGCPVIATDIKGGITREVLQDGECGVIVPQADPDAMAEAIGGLLSDPERRASYRQRGYERVSHFDLPDVIAMHEELFESVVAQPRRPVSADAGEASGGGPAIDAALPSAAPARGAGTTGERRIGTLLSIAGVTLRQGGIEAISSRLAQEVRSGVFVRFGAAGRARKWARSADKRAGKPRIIVVTGGAGRPLSAGAAVALGGLDPDRFDLRLVSLYPNLPGREGGRGPRHRVVMPSATGASPGLVGSAETDATQQRIDVWASGLARIIAEEQSDAVIADGYAALVVAVAAKRYIDQPPRILGMVHQGDVGIGHPARALHAAILSAGLDDDDLIIAPDRSTRTDVTAGLGVPEARVVVAPEPLEEELVLAQEPPGIDRPRTPPTFAYVSDDIAEQDLAYLFDGLASARRREDIRCVIVTSVAHAEAVRQAAQTRGLDDAVAVSDEVGGELLGADGLVVLRTGGSSAGSSPVFEALAARSPLIGSRSAHDVQSLIDEHGCGLAIDGNDPESLAEAMLTLAWDGELCGRLADLGVGALAQRRPARYLQSIESWITSGQSKPGPTGHLGEAAREAGPK